MQVDNINSFAAGDIFGYNGFGLPSPEVGNSDGRRVGGSGGRGKKGNKEKPQRDSVSISESAKLKARESALTVAQDPGDEKDPDTGEVQNLQEDGDRKSQPLPASDERYTRDGISSTPKVKALEQAYAKDGKSSVIKKSITDSITDQQSQKQDEASYTSSTTTGDRSIALRTYRKHAGI